jgi:hypothetical protein
MSWGWNPFKWVKDAVDTIVDFVTDTVMAIVDIVMSPFGMGMPDTGGQDIQNDILGPLLNKDSGVGNIPIIYGKRRVGGHRVFVSTNGTNNEYLYVAIVLSEGQIQGIEKFYIDDTEVPLTSYAHGVEATPTTGDYTGRVTTQFFDGRDDQTVSTLLDAAPGWDSNHRLQGLAYMACRFRWLKIESNDDSNNNPFRSGIPRITVIANGRKIYDVVDGFTPTYSGTISAVTGSGTTTYTNSTASITGVSAPPTANYSNTTTFSTTESSAILSASSVASVQYDPLVAGGQFPIQINGLGSRWASMIRKNGYQSVSVRQVLTNTDTSTVISDITDGPFRTSDLTPAIAIIDQKYSVPTGNYTLQTYTTLTGNGPQSGLPPGSFSVAISLSSSDTLTNATAYENETVAYNNNPVNVLLDYMRNPRYGKGLDNTVFDWNSIRLAAIQCNQSVPYTASTSGKYSEFDGLIDSGGTILNNIRSILTSFKGIMPYSSGKYYLKIPHGGDPEDIDGTPANPPVVMIITTDMMISGLSIQGESKDRKINQMRITYTDPEADYQPNDAIWPAEDSQEYADYLAEDNIELHQQTTIAFCTNRERALNYAETLVKTARNKMIISFTTTMQAIDVSVGDLVRIVNTNLNFDGIYRIESVGLTSEGSLQFGATEHNSYDYGLDGHAAQRARPSINLPNPLLVSAPTNLTVQSGAQFNIQSNTGGYILQDSTLIRLSVSWTAGTDPYITEYIVQYKPSADATWITVGVTSDTTIFIAPVAVGVDYDVRVASRNELDRRSNFTTVIDHTVVS